MYALTRQAAGIVPCASIAELAQSVVLAFVDSEGKVRQSLISPKLIAHTGEVVCSGKTYESLRDVVLAHSAQSAGGASAVLRAAIAPASDLVMLDLVNVAADATVFSSTQCFERVAAPCSALINVSIRLVQLL